MSKKKKRRKVKYSDIQLNIMPFIDVFSLLNTFLLMSAAFISIGLIEVQIPFLTSAPPETKVTERTLDIKVNMEKDKVEVTTEWSREPIDKRQQEFKIDAAGLAELHKHLVEVKRSSPDSDKVQFFSDDDVLWHDMAKVLDAIKLRQANDPKFPAKNAEQAAMMSEFLFPKVVMASVML